MPNSIALFKNYVPILDEVYREASRTGRAQDGAPGAGPVPGPTRAS